MQLSVLLSDVCCSLSMFASAIRTGLAEVPFSGRAEEIQEHAAFGSSMEQAEVPF